MIAKWLDKLRRPHKIGLTLSGGGLRCIGQLGALKALEEYKLAPTILSGCSAGAVIAAFYAAGYSPDKMMKIVMENDFFTRSSFRFRFSGFMDNAFLLNLFKKYVPDDSFASLNLPLYVAATDMIQGETVYINQGNLTEAIIASSSIPLVFPPLKTKDRLYYDGGVMDNLPIDPIRNQCKMLIGVHVNSIEHLTDTNLSTFKVIDRVIHLAIGQSVYRNARKCDLFIDPPGMTRFSMFSKKEAQTVYDHVYGYTASYLRSHTDLH